MPGMGAPMEVLKIGVATPPGMSAAYSYFAPAFFFGFDKAENFELEMFYGGEPNATAQALGKGECDIASLNTVVGLVGLGRGIPMIAIGSVARRTHRWFAVRQSSPIKMMKDLIGKRIACDFPHLRLLADAALLEDGVPLSSVSWVPWRGSDMNCEEMSLSLASGDVDALFLIDWNDGDFVARGMPLRHLPSKLLNRLRLSSCYWANTTALNTKHELISRGVRVLARSLMYAMEKPERTIEIAWERFPEMRPSNVGREFAFRRHVEILKARLAPMAIEPTDSSSDWGHMSGDEFQHLQDCLLQTGALARPVDVSTCFTTEFLKDFNDLGSASLRAVKIG